MTRGKYVYKNKQSRKKMCEFYDKTLAALNVRYKESYFMTSFGVTHCLLVGDPDKPKICTIHGGNGITTLNLKLFLPLLEKYCIIAPDVIGMPGKSAPYRSINGSREEYGLWIAQVLDHYHIKKISFAVSSYSSAMFLSFAKLFPERADKTLLLVPSGIAHGSVIPIIIKTVVPFMKYYFRQDKDTLGSITEVMGGSDDELWSGFFDLMMSCYKMEMRPPKEYTKKELKDFRCPVLIIASKNDIFFPADKVFARAEKIFSGPVKKILITSKHLPSEIVMKKICRKVINFFEN